MANTLGVKLLSVRGVPVYLKPSWFLLMGLAIFGYGFYLSRAHVELTAAFTVSVSLAFLIALGVLIHETAHALTGIAFNLRVEYISMTLWGGVTRLTPGSPLSSLTISLAGPIVNALYALTLLWWASFSGGALHAGIRIAAEANLMISLFNLIPSYPLDGGHALEAFISIISKRRFTAAKVTAWVGIGLIPLLLATVVYLGLWRLPAGIFLVGVICYYLWSASFPMLKTLQYQAAGTDPLAAAQLTETALVLDEQADAQQAEDKWDGVSAAILLREGNPVSWVSPGDLSLIKQGIIPAQLAHPLPSRGLPLDLLRIDVMEFFNGYQYRQLPQELRAGHHPIAWAVYNSQGQLAGLLRHQAIADCLLKQQRGNLHL